MFAEIRTRHHQPWLFALAVFFALALFDALIGGAISALLRIDGWTALDQRLNDVYHVNYAIVIAAALSWHYSHFKHGTAVLAVLILFLGYVEDTLFYFFTPLCNPAIQRLTSGETFQMAGGEIMPREISGWLGWLGRAFLGRNVALEQSVLLTVNAIAIFCAILLCGLKYKSNHQQDKR